MTTIARKAFNLNEHDNTTLSHSNLIMWAVELDQNWEKEQTAYIFKDGSALVYSYDDWKVVTNYGRHPEHEQL